MRRKYKLLVVDLDGVVWRGRRLLEENIEALQKLMKRGVEVVFLTNNSSQSRREYCLRLARAGFSVDQDHVITSGFLAAEYIKQKLSGDKVFVIGEAGLYYELSIAGLLPVTTETTADHVVVGIDRFLTFNKLKHAVRLVMSGATFIAANEDSTYPVEDGVEPGAGSIVALIERASGRKPDVVAGKPSSWVLEYILKAFKRSSEEILVIGDRIDTDVLMGLRSGVDTLLVLTGVASREDVERSSIKPSYVAENLLVFLDDNPDLF